MPEFCPGDGGVCPNDVFQSSAFVCRVADGGCDVSERCSGSSAVCPTDRFTDGGVVCRAPVNDCDVGETCSGVQSTCPADTVQPQGTTCGVTTCSAGVVSPRVCQSSNPPPVCIAARPVDCGGYTCNGAACRTNCLFNSDCLSTHFCRGSSCLPKQADGTLCTQPEQCVGGRCSAFYVDADGDGFGTGALQNRCSSGLNPPGFAATPGDCCDTDNNAFPGQTSYFRTPTACRGYDYNCNSSEEPQFPVFMCGPFTQCRNGWAILPVCGSSGSLKMCIGSLGCGSNTMTATAACR